MDQFGWRGVADNMHAAAMRKSHRANGPPKGDVHV